MSDKSAIEWTDATWNPVRGCSRVSAGCEHCYAEGVAARFSGPGQPYEGLARRAPNGEPRWTGTVRLVPEKLDEPLRWKKPRRIFVNSMSDLFHESLPDEAIDQVFAIMLADSYLENHGRHTFQILTKRAQRMRDYLSAPPATLLRRWAETANGLITLDNPDVFFSEAIEGTTSCRWREDCTRDPAHPDLGPYGYTDRFFPLPNVWLGVSVEHQEAADERIPLLLQTPATVRFLSIEPLLGPVDLCQVRNTVGMAEGQDFINTLAGRCWTVQGDYVDSTSADASVDWVIVGGESGPKARPMHPQWARNLRDQCVAAGVPFFFKQFGEWAPGDVVESRDRTRFAVEGGHLFTERALGLRYERLNRVGKKRAGRELDGRTWDEMPGARA